MQLLESSGTSCTVFGIQGLSNLQTNAEPCDRHLVNYFSEIKTDTQGYKAVVGHLTANRSRQRKLHLLDSVLFLGTV